jgi:hypothetical protein
MFGGAGCFFLEVWRLHLYIPYLERGLLRRNILQFFINTIFIFLVLLCSSILFIKNLNLDPEPDLYSKLPESLGSGFCEYGSGTLVLKGLVVYLNMIGSD